MLNKITHNWEIKIVSLIFAFMLWLIVTNVDDPVVQYRVFNVPVMITNDSVVTSKEQVYEVLNGTDKIDVVTISAKRSIIDSLNESDIKATANMNELQEETGTIPIHLSSSKYNDNLESIRGSFDTVQLNIEQKKTTTLALRTVTSGDVTEGYVIGDVTPAQNLIRVTGPESVINKVAYAAADVTVTGFVSNIETNAEVKIYDAEGHEIAAKGNTSLNVNTVKVSVEILQTKRVDLALDYVGTPAEGYQATGLVVSSPDSILVAGRSNVIANVNAITIPGEALNITGQKEDMMSIVDVTSYLPSGLRLADPSFNGKITAIVYIEAETTQEIEIDPDDLLLQNIPDGYEAELIKPEDGSYYKVNIGGLGEDLKAINLNTLAPFVDVEMSVLAYDLEQMEEGTYAGEIQIVLPDEVKMVATAQIEFELKAAE